MLKGCGLALAVLFAASSVSAAEDQNAEEPKKEKLVCKSEKVTGSRARIKRICMTREQWNEVAAETKRNIDQYSGKMTGTREGAGQAQ
jgi:hypothetical protein